MTHLRKMMLEELQGRNFSEDTIRHYIRAVEDFARHFNRPPDRLGTSSVRQYLPLVNGVIRRDLRLLVYLLVTDKRNKSRS